MELSGWWNLRCRLLCPANFSTMILGEGSRVGRQELGSNLYGALTCLLVFGKPLPVSGSGFLICRTADGQCSPESQLQL